MSKASTAESRLQRQDDRLDQVFHALADRTRRGILSRLADGSSTVGDLAAPFDMSLPAVGKHVRVLERAGLVKRDVQGRVHHCSLSAYPLQHADNWLSCYRSFWDDNLDSLADYFNDDRTVD